jgi:1,4-alpha-glucan branching enzyme
LLGEQDLYLFREGSHGRLHRSMGCQWRPERTTFRVWAPNARAVSVIGDWNDWQPAALPLEPRNDGSGLWEGASAEVACGQRYKFRLIGPDGRVLEKADPYAFYSEVAPNTASRVWDLAYQWRDENWMAGRGAANRLDGPMSCYEVHLGSWRRQQPDQLPGYRDIAQPLAEYVRDQGFSHVELMPITEHPFYGSWGYQTTGYFAPTSRYGPPQDFKYLVDVLHQHGVGVILDWVPSHFPTDAHGLAEFDGTFLYEHADPRKGFHPEWNSAIFNYDRHEVRSFLLSSALFWLEEYHVDGLRVDAVASMLYLDYARNRGEWIPNEHGGRENLGAVQFLQLLNTAVYRDHPDVQVIAEESTAWPMVSRPIDHGGLGFGLKWNMGWMHDTLDYMKHDPVHRKYHHGRLTFSLVYAFSENFVLAFSHDEVVHGKGSLIGKMPGDSWQQFANLRAMYGYMWGHPGKKLLFMGGEFGQRREWAHEQALDWELLAYPEHAGLARWVHDLNQMYRAEPALHEVDFEPAGFEWIDANNADASIIAFLRRSRSGAPMLVVCNFTPVPHFSYTLGVPQAGYWRELLNSDAQGYGGSGIGNMGGVQAVDFPAHGKAHSLRLVVPPLATIFLKPQD